MYHCAPSVLDEQDEYLVEMHWLIRNRKIMIENRKERSESNTKTVDVSKSKTLGGLKESDL